MLTGLICSGVSAAGQVWIDELYSGSDKSDLPDPQVRQALQAMADRTRDEVLEPEFEFSPLLPGDDRPFRERAIALYDWARGFVFGLGVAGVGRDGLSEQGREALGDFTEITRMDLDNLDEDEANEVALMELQEFVRVAALLIFEECGRAQGGGHVKG